MVRIFLGAVFVALALHPAGAMAQWNNQPFELRSDARGGAVGMSPAYRQAILERKLLGSRPRNLARDGAGFLLDVERGPSDQAFLRSQGRAFVPATGLGYGGTVGGIGFGGGGTFGFGGTEGGPLFLHWSSMIGEVGTAARWNGVGGGAFTPAGAVIESWIAQLPEIEH